MCILNGLAAYLVNVDLEYDVIHGHMELEIIHLDFTLCVKHHGCVRYVRVSHSTIYTVHTCCGEVCLLGRNEVRMASSSLRGC